MHKLYVKDAQFYKKVAGISIPIALQGLITSGVNMMDTIMIGKIGETELSAVSLANQFISMFHIFCMGIGMGASVLVARYFGMKDSSSLKKTLTIMFRLCLFLAFLFCFVTILIPRQIMLIYTTDEEIIKYGIDYLKYSVISYFFFGLSLTSTIVLRNIGQVRMPLYTSIGAFFVNVGANYIFIFGKLGIPKMGVAGAAIGTLISRIFEFLSKLAFIKFVFVVSELYNDVICKTELTFCEKKSLYDFFNCVFSNSLFICS